MEKEEKSIIKEDLAEIKEDLVEIKEDVVEIIEEISGTSSDSNKGKTKKSILAYIVVLILVVAAAVIITLDYPKISSYAKNKLNPYGFDYNFRKVSEYDWDTVLTEKKIASIWNISRKDLNSAKNPDWSWILEDPKQLVEEANCAVMFDEKILDQQNQDKKNLLNVNILLCKSTSEAKTTYSSRKDEIKNASQTDKTITVKNIGDIQGLGSEGYTYLIEQASAKEGSAPDKFAGTVFLRGPFMIMVDESEQEGTSYLSSGDMQLKISKYLDKEIQRLLAWY
jgi:hypothetical protein